jgi:acyl carrier protein
MTDDLIATLRRFINANFLFEDEKASLPEDTSLRDSGIIDSTGITELVCFLEETFGIAVGEDEMYPQNLDSIRALASYITRKIEAQALPRAA